MFLDDNQDDNEDNDHDNDNPKHGIYNSNKSEEMPRITKKPLPLQLKPAGNMVRIKCPAEGKFYYCFVTMQNIFKNIC